MSKGTVLVVDDDESILEFVETALKLEGYDVVAASTATQALGKVKAGAEKFPVILSDIMMPGVNGLDLLRFIHKASPDTIVVMMTAHSSVDTAIQALNEGAFAYLRKPVDAVELRSAMANAFEKYGLAEQNRKVLENLAIENEYNEQVLQHLVYTVVATDTNGNIKKANKAMEDLLGYQEKELVGQPLGKILSPVNKKTVWSDLQNSKTVSGLPLVFRDKGGSDIEVLFTGTIMRDDTGAIVGFLGTANRPEKGVENA